MTCYIHGCDNDAATELRVRYLHDDDTESAAVWIPLCLLHAHDASNGWLPVLSLLRPVRWLAQRPLEDHEHDYRIRSLVPNKLGGAVTGYSAIDVCPCGSRRLAVKSGGLHLVLPALAPVRSRGPRPGPPARRGADMSETWTNRTEIHSESSSRVYVVSEKVVNGIPTGTWGCSCPGWKGHGGQCKHLRNMGLKSCRPAAAALTRRSAPARRGHDSFSDDAYSHYDVSTEGFGSPDEWIRAAEQRAYGRGRYQRPRRTVPSQAADLALLSLTAMPADAKALVRAMRKQAMKDHPDIAGGDTERFKNMINAYERLLANYPKGSR